MAHRAPKGTQCIFQGFALLNISLIRLMFDTSMWLSVVEQAHIFGRTHIYTFERNFSLIRLFIKFQLSFMILGTLNIVLLQKCKVLLQTFSPN